MAWLLVAALLGLPSLETWLFVRLGVGWGAASLWCLATAAAGAWYARRESLTLWTELESAVQHGHLPTVEGVDTMLVVLGGWALIVPGVVTDLAGAAVLNRWVRHRLVDWIRREIRLRYL